MEWASSLWHRVHPVALIDELHQDIHANQSLIICNDAGVDAAKHSSCVWTIYGATALWQGKGVVPGNCDNTYSGRSEAFGILTALLFLQHYLKHFPHTRLTHRYQLTVYCDNGSTITQAQKYAAINELYLNQTIADDHDVYNEIAHVVAELSEFCSLCPHERPSKQMIQQETAHTASMPQC